MKFTIFDAEADGLLKDNFFKNQKSASVIYILSYQIIENGICIEKGSITDYQKMREFILAQECLVGHNVLRYDLPLFKKILGIEYKGQVIDTLGLSWYLYPYIKSHGLEAHGEALGVSKIKVENHQWAEGSPELMKLRCEQDVEINVLLFIKQFKYLNKLYDSNIFHLINYMNTKLANLRDQEEIGIDLDVVLCENTKYKLEFEIEEKTSILGEIMPKVVIKTVPKIMYKKDGTLSAHGIKWKELLKESGLPEDVTEICENGNPGSHKQLKDWLFDLGWKPITFKDSKATGEKVPQVSLPFGQGICQSVKDLYEVEPKLEELEGLYMLQHRLGLIKSLLENKDHNDKVYASASGTTNTTRYTHRVPIVNLPGYDKPYGKEIRGSLHIKPEDRNEWIMIGSDISGLEGATGDHFMYFFDPKYVKEKRVEGFDAHLDIAKLANFVTEEEENFYKSITDDSIQKLEHDEEILYKKIKKLRATAKSASFCMMYGGGIPKVAETAKITEIKARKLYNVYWDRNKAVKQVANACTIKEVNGQKWLWNPVAKLWLFLKNEKDSFSTLNQSAGCYVFTLWRYYINKSITELGIKAYILLEMHDECLIKCKQKDEKTVKLILQQAMDKVNEDLKLNVTIGISIESGYTYADVH